MDTLIFWVFLGISFLLVYRSFSSIGGFNHSPGDLNTNEIYYFQSLPFIYKEKVLVDVGCGNDGGLVKWFYEEKGVKETYGIDFEDVVNNAKLTNPQYEDHFFVGVGEEIPFDDESVDFLIFQKTFHHINDHEKCIEEIHRVLKYGGFAIFVEPVTVEGRYEIMEIAKYYISEEDEKNLAYEHIRKGESSLGLIPWDLEKTVVLKTSPKQLEKIIKMQEPEAYEKGYKEMRKHVNQVAKEDGISSEDLIFFHTNRVNVWEKRKL